MTPQQIERLRGWHRAINDELQKNAEEAVFWGLEALSCVFDENFLVSGKSLYLNGEIISEVGE